jgi:type I restriction enzyme M protein
MNDQTQKQLGKTLWNIADQLRGAMNADDFRDYILVLKKCKKPDDVLFINAAKHFAKGKRQNQLLDCHIAKIIETYQFRKDEERYSKRVSMERIAEEGYNLNISRYISTAVGEEEIELAATHGKLVELDEQIRTATAKHNTFLEELGLSPLPT